MNNDRLKFRAWNQYHKKMYRVYSMYFDEGIAKCENEQAGKSTFHSFGFSDLDLIQWTGRTDKNEDEIYEGHIIEAQILIGHPTKRCGGSYWVKYLCVVEYCITSSGYVLRAKKQLNEIGMGFGSGHTAVINKDCEILGNKYEDGDLLL